MAKNKTCNGTGEIVVPEIDIVNGKPVVVGYITIPCEGCKNCKKN